MRDRHQHALIEAIAPALVIAVVDGLAEAKAQVAHRMRVAPKAVDEAELLLEPGLLSRQAEGVLNFDIGRAQQAEVEAAAQGQLLYAAGQVGTCPGEVAHALGRHRLTLIAVSAGRIEQQVVTVGRVG